MKALKEKTKAKELEPTNLYHLVSATPGNGPVIISDMCFIERWVPGPPKSYSTVKEIKALASKRILEYEPRENQQIDGVEVRYSKNIPDLVSTLKIRSKDGTLELIS